MGLLSTLGGIAGSFFGGPIGGSIGGALGGFFDNKSQQDDAESFSLHSAQANRDFQERMSNTSWQRGMKDMEAAGLNPMLAFSQGGASVPTGGAAVYPGAVGAAYQSADASSAASAAASQQAQTAEKVGNATVNKIKQEITNLGTVNEQVKSIIRNLGEEYQNLIKEGYNKVETGNLLRAQIDRVFAEIPQINSGTWLNEARTALTEMEKRLKSLDVSAAEKFDNLGRDVQQLGPVFELLKSIVRMRSGK